MTKRSRKKILNKILKFLKTPKGIIFLSIIIVISSIFIFTRGEDAPIYETALAERKDITQIVSVTGRVQAAKGVDLGPEKGGKVTRIDVGIGSKVERGDILLSTNNANLQAQLSEAKANLEIEKIKFGETGETSEIDIANARDDLIDKITDAYTKADSAIRSNTDQLFVTSKWPVYDTSIYYIELSIRNDINSRRAEITRIFDKWNRINMVLDSEEDISNSTETAEDSLEFVQDFLNLLASEVNMFPNTTELNSYKAIVSNARADVNLALTNLRSSHQSYLSIEAENRSGFLLEDVLIQEENVKNAQARVNAIYAQIEETMVRAPFNGFVTKIDAELGEIIQANTEVVSIISDAEFEIETFIPEADIAEVKKDDSAEVTLDAYGPEDLFIASVTEIDLAETVIEGVSTYKVILQFDEGDDRIKPGMTANTEIVTGMSKNAIAIPQRSVIDKEGKKIVRVFTANEDISEIEVKTGLRGFDGDIEIISGIKEGDEVVVFIRE